MKPSRILAPEIPVLVLGTRRAVWLTADGEIDTLDLRAAQRRARDEAPLVAHGRAVARRLELRDLRAFDALELFAFTCPGQFCLPTPRGLMMALGLGRAGSLEDQAMGLADSVPVLLDRIQRQATPILAELAQLMAAGDWPWGPAVLAALGAAPLPGRPRRLSGLDIWSRLPEWEEAGPVEPPSHYPVDPADARGRLAELVQGRARHDASSANGAPAAEARPQQADYASAVSAAFAPKAAPDEPNLVLAEAGTGVGKTLGYLAPASLWAERNGGPVWVSTFTRNLQTQIDGELDRLYPDPRLKAERVVLRKGRENYLCLLNFEEAAQTVLGNPANAVGLGLMARWAMATKDGALVGGDFPGWLVDLIGRAQSLGLADRRGECIYSACPHYSRCFIEHSIRRARRADIVVANHALVLVQAALGGLDDATVPTRYVFDEGHHLFEAADSAFSAQLSGLSAADLRRWILGAEGGAGRARGMRRRYEDLVAGDDAATDDLQAILVSAAVLPGDGWLHRLAEGEPRHPIEKFLALVRQQVLARAQRPEANYDLETERQPAIEGLAEAALEADQALAGLEAPILRLVKYLAKRLDEEAEELDTAVRTRIEAAIRSLERRAVITLAAWRAMLKDLPQATPEGMVDWLSISRQDGREVDVGLHRHWIDPTEPFAKAVVTPAHGVVVTSATLTDGTGDAGVDWQAAEARTGAVHVAAPAIRARVPSPFDYANQTRCLVVTDVRKDDLDQVAAAYRELFLAAGGGGLGLFTAISRLKAVRERILAPLDDAGIELLSQHVDPVDVGTLIDIFRAEEDACLLGTDAVRDGVDVPGRSLRLIVFDRVPWPRPDILHKARRQDFGSRGYDDMLTRLKLRQAFGRLIRRAGDQGVFVLLDPMMPSRLYGAFPEGVDIRRVGLKEAVEETKYFLRPEAE
ncbi:DNA helicase [Aliidongia dinghuensis]|uniref:DNA helicase n=1 Tax=Aliidongia dinghuensis TaxID=1867774 RepID=A0A8J2YZF6_9PROT|nr:DNA helicase [Aliidongia dinghuensis]